MSLARRNAWIADLRQAADLLAAVASEIDHHPEWTAIDSAQSALEKCAACMQRLHNAAPSASDGAVLDDDEIAVVSSKTISARRHSGGAGTAVISLIDDDTGEAAGSAAVGGGRKRKRDGARPAAPESADGASATGSGSSGGACSVYHDADDQLDSAPKRQRTGGIADAPRASAAHRTLSSAKEQTGSARNAGAREELDSAANMGVVAVNKQESGAPRCALCGSQPDGGSGGSSSAASTLLFCASACTHFMCTSCLNNQTIQACNSNAVSMEGVRCPCPSLEDRGGGACGEILAERELRDYLGTEAASKLAAAIQRAIILAAGVELVTCPSCNAQFEATQGSVGDMRKDAQNRTLSKRQMEHLAHNRVRCNVCSTNFCRGCAAVPYHSGKTCSEAAAYAASRKCRFCEGALDPAAFQAALTAAQKALADAQAGKPVAQAASSASSSKGRRGSKVAPETADDVLLVLDPKAVEEAEVLMQLANTCGSAECQAYARQVCPQTHACGHECCGVRGEADSRFAATRSCLPCLQDGCWTGPDSYKASEYCSICWVAVLSGAPCIQLGCGHVFHLHCVAQRIKSGPPGARLTFAFLDCPACKQGPISHWALESTLQPWIALKRSVEEMAVARLRFEKLEKDVASSPHANKPNAQLEYAMDRFAYYECTKCKKPYFGGMRACGEAAAEQRAGPPGGAEGAGAGAAAAVDGHQRLCSGCSELPPGVTACAKHGKDSLVYKCKYCCSESVWFCWGTTHFCEPCHIEQVKNRKVETKACAGGSKCPLGGKHAANGNEFALACIDCKAADAGF